MSKKNKTRILISFALIFLSSFTYFAKAQTAHTYALGLNYYYLKIYESNEFEIKIGMYNAETLTGECFLQGDTLNLINFKFPKNKYSENQQQKIQDSFGKYLVHDSLLIPKILYDKDFKQVRRAARDSKLIDKYIISDGHAYYEMNLKLDSIFSFRTGTDAMRSSVIGKWKRKDNLLNLYPESDKGKILPWICTNNVMIFFDNYLIGKVTDSDEIIYLIKR
jgi:hypothetical protein